MAENSGASPYVGHAARAVLQAGSCLHCCPGCHVARQPGVQLQPQPRQAGQRQPCTGWDAGETQPAARVMQPSLQLSSAKTQAELTLSR